MQATVKQCFGAICSAADAGSKS